jgi:DNA-binding transcriptional regulator YiaG
MLELDALALARVRRWGADGTARRLRQDAQLSQNEVALVCGVTNVAVNHWERGLARPRGEPGLRYAALISRLATEMGSASDAQTR